MRSDQTNAGRMKRKLLFGLFFISVFFLLTGAVMYLWNIILPGVIHVPAITYWQALSLMILCRILFGRFSFGSPLRRRRGEGQSGVFKDRLMNMDEKDRSTFKEEWKRRCERRGERK